MKKGSPRKLTSEMREEYDFSGGTRGKYAARFAEGSNVVILDPDIASVFPDSRAVNAALRVLSEAAKHQVRSPSR